MPIDSSIAMGVKPPQIESPLNALSQVLQAQGLQNQNALATYSLNKAQRGDADMNALMQHLAGGGNLTTPEGQAAAFRVAPLSAPALIKQQMEQAKLASETSLNTAKTAKTFGEATLQRITQYRDLSQSVNDPQGAVQLVTAMHQDPALKDTPLAQMPIEQALAQIPQDPAQLNTWKQKFALGAQKFIELNAPKTTVVNAGGTSQVLQTPGLGGAPTLAASVPHTVSPDAQLQASTSRANNADTLKKDYAVAGINPDGSSSGANDSMVDAIGQYKVAPPNGMALRNPRMQQILADVTAKYPDFDATQYGARQAAAKSFSTGKDGQSVQSANTALNHLATLKELAAAQDNGDIRLFNTLANRFATETGGAAPTNLASAVTMVGPEISKAVIGVGGGQGDREKVDSALASLTKGGKAQAAGTIATMQDLFGGRLTETQRTYERTTGRKDFPATFLSPAAQAVLAARNPAGAASSVPPDIAAILQKHGGK